MKNGHLISSLTPDEAMVAAENSMWSHHLKGAGELVQDGSSKLTLLLEPTVCTARPSQGRQLQGSHSQVPALFAMWLYLLGFFLGV